MNNVEKLHKIAALYDAYWAQGIKFNTLEDAKEYCVKHPVYNKDGYLTVMRPMLESFKCENEDVEKVLIYKHYTGFVKNYYGRICYGPAKYEWFERIENARV